MIKQSCLTDIRMECDSWIIQHTHTLEIIHFYSPPKYTHMHMSLCQHHKSHSEDYLGRVFLHCLEVEERGVDQVIAMDDGYQLPFDVVTLPEAQHLPHLWVLKHTHTHF